MGKSCSNANANVTIMSCPNGPADDVPKLFLIYCQGEFRPHVNAVCFENKGIDTFLDLPLTHFPQRTHSDSNFNCHFLPTTTSFSQVFLASVILFIVHFFKFVGNLSKNL